MIATMSNTSSDPLGEVKLRREALAAAADDLERAVTRAVADEQQWRADVAAAVVEVDSALRSHIEEVERPDGLYDEIMLRSPRLAHAIDRLRREHETMSSSLSVLGGLVADPSQGDVEVVCDRALAVLTDISRHRHRGADLVWESYDFDIGEGD